MIRSRCGILIRSLIALSFVYFSTSVVSAATPKGQKGPPTKGNEKSIAAAATATPAEQLKLLKGFKAELIYSVPKEKEGSWVNLCVDPKGRLITSDQIGPLYRITPPAVGQAGPPKIERIPAEIGGAHGLLWAFDALYVMVNKTAAFKNESGLYRVTSSRNNDQLDKIEQLLSINGAGEHGPHAILLSPDKKSLHIVVGDGTKFIEPATSRVPRLWGEDHLLPRMPDGRGFMKDVLAPGGCIYKSDPNGKNLELITNGYRNQFDAAFNRDGELFTYDADMEWDFNTPWYRPTRICHATSGSEFGWRNGAGKWPEYYADSLPAIYNVGPGCPTGMTFGYGAKFPAKYRDALYSCDWSYGKLYAGHLQPAGSTYTMTMEEFVIGTPLPLTDVVVNPVDGALYFTIGGRQTQSGLYRVTYVGSESTAEVAATPDGGQDARAIRHKLEAFHGKKDSKAVEVAWPYLGDADRFIRFAARVAIEHQDPSSWEEKALTETSPHAAITALLALVRVRATDPFHRKSGDRDGNPVLESRIAASLEKIDWEKLTVTQRLELVRVYSVMFNRCGKPSAEIRQRTIAKFDSVYPTKQRELNADLSNLMVYLQAPSAAGKTIKMLADAPTQEEQIEYARALRMLKEGWTPELRKSYFQWFVKAATYKGGNSFALFVEHIKEDAVKNLSDAEKKELKPILEAKPETALAEIFPPRPMVKNWTMDEVEALAEKGLVQRDFDRGRKMFAAAKCFACHRYDNDGGANGPDLTSAAGRFNRHDLIESIVLPSKVIGDQYAAVQIQTTDGKVIVGRVVNHSKDSMVINTDMLSPNQTVSVDRNKIDVMVPSKTSMMPEGLLNTFHEDEMLDLLAYLLSRGDRNNPMFDAKK